MYQSALASRSTPAPAKSLASSQSRRRRTRESVRPSECCDPRFVTPELYSATRCRERLFAADPRDPEGALRIAAGRVQFAAWLPTGWRASSRLSFATWR